ncbi:hypothetical protein TN53_12270 [Streptomyces sp. WM6386]|nr:hypothetical protein TN53_12270 [Streptomyces sp. WM6386]
MARTLYDFGYACVERGVPNLAIPALREALRQLLTPQGSCGGSNCRSASISWMVSVISRMASRRSQRVRVREQAAGSVGPACDGWDLVEQGQESGDAVAVVVGQRHRERDALAVDDEVVLAARLGPLVWATAGRAEVRGVDHRAGPVQLVLRAQFPQQHHMELLPGAGLVPGSRTRSGRQRLDQRPQFMRRDPRPRLTFPHNQTSERTSPQSRGQQFRQSQALGC